LTKKNQNQQGQHFANHNLFNNTNLLIADVENFIIL